MIKKILITTIIGVLLNNVEVNAQYSASYLSVGQQIEDYTFSIRYDFPKGKTSIKDFQGKWLILDFWGYFCGACIASFPKMNKIQADFKDKLDLVFVGENARWSKDKIRPLYELHKKRKNLQFASAFDSVLFEKFKITTVPYIVVINPEGVIKAITYEIDSLQLAGIISGATVALKPYSPHSGTQPLLKKYNRDNLFLTNGTGGNDTSFVYRSLISKLTTRVDSIPGGYLTKGIGKGRLEVLNVSAEALFRYAYFEMFGWSLMPSVKHYGKVYDKVIFRNRDSLNLMHKGRDGEHYCYSLKVPLNLANGDFMHKKMQTDLADYFNVSASFEKIEVPVLKLRIIDQKKVSGLVTKTPLPKPYVEPIDGSFDAGRFLKSARISSIVQNYVGKIISHSKYRAIIDETNFNEIIDIKIHAFSESLDEIRIALNKNGLDLIPEDILMDVLVIRDK